MSIALVAKPLQLAKYWLSVVFLALTLNTNNSCHVSCFFVWSFEFLCVIHQCVWQAALLCVYMTLVEPHHNAQPEPTVQPMWWCQRAIISWRALLHLIYTALFWSVLQKLLIDHLSAMTTLFVNIKRHTKEQTGRPTSRPTFHILQGCCRKLFTLNSISMYPVQGTVWLWYSWQ